MVSAKTRSITTWALAVLLAILFLLSGWGKLANTATAGGVTFDEQFVALGLPAWFRFPVGIAEMVGAVALLVPRIRWLAAGALSLLMLGAVGTHLANAEWIAAPFPLVLAVMAATLGWMSRPAFVTLDARQAQVA